MNTASLKRYAIVAAVSAVVIGFVMKRARDQIKAGTKVEETIAGKLGLVA